MGIASFRRTALVSFLLTLLIWSAFTWPLPRHVSSGIPSSAHNVEKGGVRRMIAGDHLQLHYFYRLFSDMLAGKTPFWHNLYEFNTGDDSARRQVGNYNMPMSLVYAIARVVGGNAFAWNFTGFLTLWASFALAWLLTRRYTLENKFSWLLALPVLIVPYRWIALLGGSPTGFAILWVPLLLLGLDMSGRDDSLKGGLLAATAILLSYWNDPHTFFFSVLIVPVGYLAGFARRKRLPWRKPNGLSAAALSVAPPAAVVIGLVAIGMVVKSATFDGTTMQAGRGLNEVLLFTPRFRGLLGWRSGPVDLQIFIGYAFLIFFGVHLAVLPWVIRFLSPASKASHLSLVLLVYGAIIGVAILAMGPHAPVTTILFRACRRFLPGYEMIRQTAKIYALMPALLAVATAVAGMDLMRLFRTRGAKWAVCALPVVVAAFEALSVVKPTVCLVDNSQAAYEAVHLDAEADPQVEHAHALAIPLWPGDSHWASLYQHYALLYRIRMLNGYSPIVSEEYRDLVEQKLAGVNGGLFTENQIDILLEMGVRYVLFHEDAFPEQISAYPSFLTLRRLLHHPRLEFLEQDGSVWAFKIDNSDTKTPSARLPDGPYFPTRRWNAAACGLEGGRALAEEETWGGSYVALDAGGRLEMPLLHHMYAPDPRLWVRMRGDGVCRWHRHPNDSEPVRQAVRSSAWKWFALALPGERQELRVSMQVLEGGVEIDMMTLIAGGWELPQAGETVSLPACLFFSSGFTELRDNSVTLRPDYDAASNVFYGPRLPFPAGSYSIALRYSSAAPDGTHLGDLVIHNGDQAAQAIPVYAGDAAEISYAHRVNLPLEVRFFYTRNAEITIQAMDFEFLE